IRPSKTWISPNDRCRWTSARRKAITPAASDAPWRRSTDRPPPARGVYSPRTEHRTLLLGRGVRHCDRRRGLALPEAIRPKHQQQPAHHDDEPQIHHHHRHIAAELVVREAEQEWPQSDAEAEQGEHRRIDRAEAA